LRPDPQRPSRSALQKELRRSTPYETVWIPPRVEQLLSTT